MPGQNHFDSYETFFLFLVGPFLNKLFPFFLEVVIVLELKKTNKMYHLFLLKYLVRHFISEKNQKKRRRACEGDFKQDTTNTTHDETHKVIARKSFFSF